MVKIAITAVAVALVIVANNSQFTIGSMPFMTGTLPQRSLHDHQAPPHPDFALRAAEETEGR